MIKSSFALVAATLVALATTGCVTEEQHSGTGSIQFRDAAEDFRVVDVFAVSRDDAQIGLVEKTLSLDGDAHDENDRYVYVVRDQDGGMLGFVTDESLAYRRKAHQDSAELVANLPRLEENVAAVFGFYDKNVTLVDLTKERRSD